MEPETFDPNLGCTVIAHTLHDSWDDFREVEREINLIVNDDLWSLRRRSWEQTGGWRLGAGT
jgi:hypothetical protein